MEIFEPINKYTGSKYYESIRDLQNFDSIMITRASAKSAMEHQSIGSNQERQETGQTNMKTTNSIRRSSHMLAVNQF